MQIYKLSRLPGILEIKACGEQCRDMKKDVAAFPTMRHIEQ